MTHTHTLFFTHIIRLVAPVLACVHAITYIKWRRNPALGVLAPKKFITMTCCSCQRLGDINK